MNKLINYTFQKNDSCPFCGTDKIKNIGKRLNASQGLNPHKKVGISVSVMKCKNCELVFPNPLPIPESVKDHYDVSPESYWTSDYFTSSDINRDNDLIWMNSIQKVELGSKILDIGAGIGKAMIYLEKKGYDVYGIEPSEVFYNRAISLMGVNKQKLQLVSIEDCTFEENTFDVIFIEAVLEHVYNPSEIVLKIMKWLKPNGLLFIEVPSSNWLTNRIINFLYKIRGIDYVANLSPMHEPFHLYEFTIKTFEAHSLKNDYEIVDYSYFVCDTFLPKWLDLFLKPIMKKTNTGMELAIWLRKKK